MVKGVRGEDKKEQQEIEQEHGYFSLDVRWLSRRAAQQVPVPWGSEKQRVPALPYQSIDSPSGCLVVDFVLVTAGKTKTAMGAGRAGT